MTNHSFRREMEPPSSRHGWMDCWLVINDSCLHLSATSVFPPFHDLLNFTRAIAANDLPSEFFWDEEGYGALFQAQRVEPDGGPLFHLKVKHRGETVIDAAFDRMQTVQGLLESLRGVALDCPGAESEWEFPYFLVEDFEHSLAQGFSTHQEASLSSMAHFVFSHSGGYGGLQHPSFDIWVDDRMAVAMFMYDIPRFWQDWFTFLEEIGKAKLPAEAVLQKIEEDLPDDIDEMILIGWETCLRFLANPLPDEKLFQFEAFWTGEGHESPRQLVSAVLDRRQFVMTFVQGFQDFLNMNYPAYLEGSPQRFNLYSLPLDRLRQITT